MLKSRRLGYDGKGQYVVRSQRDFAAAWAAVG
ncbi:MAG: ATP-grasp domain-containing protein, partial [Planctomycetes bacterium]|nr:ATP-grasp domain-containing protein [Planctomycetota bacterium]